MTPEERAAKILRDYRHETGSLMFDPLFVGRAIVAAIRVAVEEEREACALACEVIADDKHAQFKGHSPHAPDNDHRADTYTEGESDGAHLCAATIRTRVTPATPPDTPRS